MAEFRQDLLTGKWVVISPERARRPIPRQKQPIIAVRKFTPLLLRRTKVVGTKEYLEVHANAYPAVQSWLDQSTRVHQQKTKSVVAHSAGAVKPGAGEQLIIKFSNNRDLAEATSRERQAFAASVTAELRRIENYSSVGMVALFRNNGFGAGATVEQPHHQLWALTIPSNNHEQEITWLKNQRQCPTCQLIKNSKPWLVARNAHAIMFCPPASQFPATVTIVPRRHENSFTNLTSSAQNAVLELVGLGIKKLRKRYGDISFNEVWHEYLSNDKRTHFRIEILPRLMQPASLEFGHQLFINSQVPEKIARELRTK